jgi:hypothetical protein
MEEIETVGHVAYMLNIRKWAQNGSRNMEGKNDV